MFDNAFIMYKIEFFLFPATVFYNLCRGRRADLKSCSQTEDRAVALAASARALYTLARSKVCRGQFEIGIEIIAGTRNFVATKLKPTPR